VSLAFPHRDDVVADIVLIAWRRVDTLRACLASLLAMTDAPPFGVRIAANGASDEVQDFLRDEVDGAVVVDIAENIGFGGGCNAAAAGSTADYLVFLNDDTIVDEHWLAALVRAASRESADAVGSLLLNADGTVNEAGARILPDGSPIPWAAGLVPSQARALGLLEPRDIDYGSGAALLVKRELFEELGGFDLAYAPAYYEDVDLCFRIKAAGGAVRFAPEAAVTHYTGASTRDQGWFLRFAVQHGREVFESRWQGALRSAPPLDAPVEALVPIAGGATRASRGLDDLPTGARSRDFALGIARRYSAWLERSLDETHRRVEEFHQAELAARRETDLARQETRQLEIEVTEVRAHAHSLYTQIDSLISAHPFNVLRWHRRARRARG
jgi:GT2 family glycosyltransferase